MWRRLIFYAGLSTTLSLGGCAGQPAADPHAPGFFWGLLHGLIALPTLAGSPFLSVRMYAFPNDGPGYDVGFSIGFCFALLWVLLPLVPRIGGFITSRR
jgi:hypothetical protein